VFPFRNETKRTAFPAVTLIIITLCTAVFTSSNVLANDFIKPRGFVPVDFMYALFHPSAGLFGAWLVLCASFFMHGGLGHLLGNMWYLWLFGPPVEDRIGRLPFALLYFSCGIVSMIIQTASSPLSNTPVIGASGAIAGIMGCSMVLLPFARLACYFPPVFIFRIPAFIFLLLWFWIQYINVRYGNAATTMVAWWAHIGGYASGAIAGTILLVRMRSRPVRYGVKKR
jgi:membrane associated rhomboid family serine protease